MALCVPWLMLALYVGLAFAAGWLVGHEFL